MANAMIRFSMICLCMMVHGACDPTASTLSGGEPTTAKPAAPRTVEDRDTTRSSSPSRNFNTKNFVVNCDKPELSRELAEAAERFRQEISLELLDKELQPWSKPCQIHVTTGRMGTGGVTTFNFHNGKVTDFVMQIQGSEEAIFSVLRHEVCHTILASHFRRPLPRWIDEGIATLFESEDEQKRLVILCREAGSKTIPFRRLMTLKDYPQDMREVLLVYAQGATAIRYLVERADGDMKSILRFLQNWFETGDWSRRLREEFKIQSVEAFEKGWREWLGLDPDLEEELSAPSDQTPNSDKTLELLYFFDASCIPCQTMKPAVDRLVGQGFPIRMVSVDSKSKLAEQYRISAIPTVIVLFRGHEINRESGVLSETQLRRLAKQQLIGEKETRLDLDLEEALDAADMPTVRISVKSDQGIKNGSGTILSSDFGQTVVVTCAHLFSHKTTGAPLEIECRLVPRPHMLEKVVGKLELLDTKADLGIVTFSTPFPLPHAKLTSTSEPLPLETRLFSIGWPNGSMPRIERHVLKAINKYERPDNLECSVPPKPGYSGAGLFKGDELVGVCIAGDQAQQRGVYTAVGPILACLKKFELSRDVREEKRTEQPEPDLGSLSESDDPTSPPEERSASDRFQNLLKGLWKSKDKATEASPTERISTALKQTKGRLEELDIDTFHISVNGGCRFVFVCYWPKVNYPDPSYRFRAEAEDPLKAIESVLNQIAESNLSKPKERPNRPTR